MRACGVSGKRLVGAGVPFSDLGRVQEDPKALSELLAGEAMMLRKERNKLKANTETVTDDMLTDVQQLLEILGVPYVLAPSEAEAQCAELERLKLVDGTITDDNDAFLFGSRHVFKNIFSDNKYVEWHVMDNIEQVNPDPSTLAGTPQHPTPLTTSRNPKTRHWGQPHTLSPIEGHVINHFAQEFRLNRQQLIYLALLLGCDYCDGVRGVGIVNAIEILRAFPSVEVQNRISP